MRPLRLASLSIALLAICALPSFAADLAGVEMDGKITVGDQDLVLNGMGLRSKMMFKVYVAGLYLPEKASNADALWACWIGPKPGPGEDFKNGLLGH